VFPFTSQYTGGKWLTPTPDGSTYTQGEDFLVEVQLIDTADSSVVATAKKQVNP
jgi:hypothetical protein